MILYNFANVLQNILSRVKDIKSWKLVLLKVVLKNSYGRGTQKIYIRFTSSLLSFIGAFKSRSSRPEVFCKKGDLKNFAKFTGEHLCQSLFFNKVADLRFVALLKMRLWHRCFPVNFVKFLRTPFFKEHLWSLLL